MQSRPFTRSSVDPIKSGTRVHYRFQIVNTKTSYPYLYLFKIILLTAKVIGVSHIGGIGVF